MAVYVPDGHILNRIPSRPVPIRSLLPLCFENSLDFGPIWGLICNLKFDFILPLNLNLLYDSVPRSYLLLALYIFWSYEILSFILFHTIVFSKFYNYFKHILIWGITPEVLRGTQVLTLVHGDFSRQYLGDQKLLIKTWASCM